MLRIRYTIMIVEMKSYNDYLSRVSFGTIYYVSHDSFLMYTILFPTQWIKWSTKKHYDKNR